MGVTHVEPFVSEARAGAITRFKWDFSISPARANNANSSIAMKKRSVLAFGSTASNQGVHE
jgi:hypothetical protein